MFGFKITFVNKFQRMYAFNFLALLGWFNLFVWIKIIFPSFKYGKLALQRDASAIDSMGWWVLFGFLIFLSLIGSFVAFMIIEYVFKGSCKWAFNFPMRKSIFYNIFFYVGIVLNFIVLYCFLPHNLILY